MLALFADNITTDHISPAGNIKNSSPAGSYLGERQVLQRDFNSYGSRRGNHEVMMRGTFANIRIKNEMLGGIEGGWTKKQPGGEQLPIYDAAMQYKKEGVPLVVFGGKEYGMGSSRDWAAKGTALLGIKAVIVESFERIHRSNLVGMGVLPLTFKDGATRHSLNLTGDETIDILGLDGLRAGMDLMMKIHRDVRRGRRAVGQVPGRYRRRGRILQERRHPAVRAAGDGPRCLAAVETRSARLAPCGARRGPGTSSPQPRLPRRQHRRRRAGRRWPWPSSSPSPNGSVSRRWPRSAWARC